MLAMCLVVALPINADAAKKKSTLPSMAQYSAVFDSTYYANKYPDLKATFGSDANALFAHFYNSGMAEGRQGSEEFNVQAYMNRYPDLKAAYGNNLKAYYTHYITTGKAEGRNGRANASAKTVAPAPKKVPTSPSQLSGGYNIDFTQLACYNAKGQMVTGDIFKNYDITMVNCWTTWCGYCVREMPGLEELYKQLPSNVNMISICFDATDSPSRVDYIMRNNGITFEVLCGDDYKNVPFNTNGLISGWPTTLYIDRNGKVVYETSGAPRDPVSAYSSYINYALSLTK